MDMSGGEGRPQVRPRRTAKTVAAAATAMGPQAPTTRRCSGSTKRKASGKEEATASGRTPRLRSSGRNNTNTKDDEETAAAGAEKPPAADPEGVKKKPQTTKGRLPAKDVRWILAQETRAPPETYQALRRRNPELVPRPGEEEGDEELAGLYLLARAFYAMQERFPRLQDWVRRELRDKGCVEVDEEWFRSTAEAQAVIDREWPRIRAKMDQLCLSDGGGGGDSDSDSESDDSDEEEGDDETSTRLNNNSMTRQG